MNPLPWLPPIRLKIPLSALFLSGRLLSKKVDSPMFDGQRWLNSVNTIWTLNRGVNISANMTRFNHFPPTFVNGRKCKYLAGFVTHVYECKCQSVNNVFALEANTTKISICFDAFSIFIINVFPNRPISNTCFNIIKLSGSTTWHVPWCERNNTYDKMKPGRIQEVQKKNWNYVYLKRAF